MSPENVNPEIVNTEQSDAWNGREGQFWAEQQERFDRTIQPYHVELMEAAAVAPGERVIDIGCGNGLTTRDAARAASPDGSALGLDLSAPMLARARALAERDGVTNVEFTQGDAQVAPLPPAAFDLVLSRFGVMFFSDPVAAFTNISGAVRPGGRLTNLVWGPGPRNQWILTIRGALAQGRDLPMPPPDAPGPFSLADPERFTGILTAAGFTDVEHTACEKPFHLGKDAYDAYNFAINLPPVIALLADLDEGSRKAALEDLHRVIDSHAAPEGVVLGSMAWVVTARKA